MDLNGLTKRLTSPKALLNQDKRRLTSPEASAKLQQQKERLTSVQKYE